MALGYARFDSYDSVGYVLTLALLALLALLLALLALLALLTMMPTLLLPQPQSFQRLLLTLLTLSVAISGFYCGRCCVSQISQI